MRKSIVKIAFITAIACMLLIVAFFAADIGRTGLSENSSSSIKAAEESGSGATSETDTDSTVWIEFVPVDTAQSDGLLVPNTTSGKIMLGVKVRNEDEEVSLTIKTRNKSALSGTDYDAASTDYTLTQNKGMQYFTVQTYKTDAAGLIKTGENGVTTRIFEVILCNITVKSGAKYKVTNEVNSTTEGKASFDCNVLARYEYEYAEKDGKTGLYFTDYLEGKSFSSIWFDRNNIYYQTPSGKKEFAVDNDSNYGFSKSFGQFIDYNYLLKYRQTGWADIYYGGSAVISESGWCTVSTPAVLKLFNSANEKEEVFYSEYYDPYCGGAPVLFGETQYAYNNNSDYHYYLKDSAKTWLNNNPGYRVYNTDDPMYKHAYNFNSQKYYNFPSVTGKVYKSNAEVLTLSITRDSTWKMVFEALRIDSELYDTTKPYITQTSLDDVTDTDNKILRLSVRFSEPVHFATDAKKEDVAITGSLNGNPLNTVTFGYVGGEGTDTLYFECNADDYKSYDKITSIKIDYSSFGGEAFKGLADYAYNFDLSNNFTDFSDFKGETYSLNIDLRKPEISEIKRTTSGNAQKSHTVSVKINNIAKEGSKVYYTWVKKEDLNGSEVDKYVPTTYSYVRSETTSFIVVGEKFDGEYYLFVKARSAYGTESVGHSDLLTFDNTPVKVSAISLGTANAALKERILTVSLEGEASDLKTVNMYFKESGDATAEWTKKSIYDKDSSTNAMTFTFDEEKRTSDGKMTVTAETVGVTGTDNKRFYFKFVTTDNAGNEFVYETSEAYLFDTSDRCAVDLTIKGTAYDIYDVIEVGKATISESSDTEGKQTYRNTYLAKDFTLTFSMTDTTGLSVAWLKKGTQEVNCDDYFDVNGNATGTNKITLTYKATDGSDSGGLFSIQMAADGKKSEIFTFFLVGDNDTVGGYEKIQKDKLITDKVWIASEPSYYYLDSSGTVNVINNYNKSGSPLAFSSESKAIEYYTFMEMQDLMPVKLTHDLASNLNTGRSDTTKKADNEDKEANEGQIWIRYKESDWNQSNDSKHWKYYFYSETEEQIDIGNLSGNLTAAINAVVTTLTQGGEYVYLTGDGMWTSRNVPYLDASRIKPVKISVEKTLSGGGFSKELAFSGDSELYGKAEYVDGNEKSYPFAVQEMPFTENKTYYYKSAENTKYVKLDVTSSFYLKDKITGTGVYDIIERDEKGARKYSVYIDNSAPDFSIMYTDADGEHTTKINKETKTFNAKSFSVTSLTDADEDAYVAVYGKTDGKLITVGSTKDATEIKLADGKYDVYVYDRSGNGYSFVLRISSADLKAACSYKLVEDESLTFTCTYPTEDVYRFAIYLDKVPIVSGIEELSGKGNKITFYEGGTYRFYVEDLYGNEYDEEVKFTREAPKVTWYFKEDGGEYKKVKDESERKENEEVQLGFTQTRIGISDILITSKGQVKFRFPTGKDYKYKVISGTVTERDVFGETEVEIHQTDNWQIKVYYEKFDRLFTVYSGKSDTSAPTITATTNRIEYVYNDEQGVVIDWENIKDGDTINITDVSFRTTAAKTETVSDGEFVTSGIVSVKVSDLTGLYELIFTYNGNVIEEYKENFPDRTVFDKQGEYTISATDKMGNKSALSFTIGSSERTSFVLDGNYIGGQTEYYGHDKIVARLEGAGEAVFVMDGEYFKLSTDGKNLVRTTLVAVKNTAESEFVAEKQETIIADELTAKPVKIAAASADGEVRAYLKDGFVYVEVALKESEEGETRKINVKMRVCSAVIRDSKYIEVELSDEKEYLTYGFGPEEDKKTGTLDKTLYVNTDFTITADGNKIFGVKYSKIGDFAEPYEESEVVNKFNGTEEGFYEFTLRGKYGVNSTVRVIYSVGIAITGSVVYKDGESVKYSVGYDGEFASDYIVTFTAPKSVTEYAAKKDEAEYSGFIVTETDEEIIITVQGNGEYVFEFKDSYGNKAEKTVVISDKELAYSDEWLSGLNDKALRKADGYTNRTVGFVKKTTEESGIKFISVAFGATKVVVFDEICEENVEFNENYRIGSDGDGEYAIVFRDKFGNKAEKKIRYKSGSTLGGSRTTRTREQTDYEITADVLQNGIWSNKTITLSSTASVYRFKVNSETRDLPFTMSFPSEADNGKFVYTIEYLDEYGFSYEFECVLYRASVEVKPYEMIVTDGVTKDPVAVSFEDGYAAEIAINGGEATAYISETKYSRDGSYVISVFDKAGNAARYSVKRDSVAEFYFYTTNTEQKLVSGEVTDNSAVYFAPLNGDDVSYYAVYRDGKEISGYDAKSFTESGKWEIVVRDGIGNKGYFMFYLVTHALISFEYETPYGFRITEATRTYADGKIDYMDAVDDGENTSNIKLDENGEYELVMTSSLTGKTSAFKVTIDKTVPLITLDGAENGGVTKNNVKISGCKEGDTVYVYRNGALEKEIKVATSADVPEITEKGKYKIVVVNVAGGRTEVEFERVYTANVATTALIIGVIIVVVIGLFVGLLFRKRSRVE